jgi:tetratricopeptide (TPR) repeat protein
LLRYLSVFAGGFTFEATETLCADHVRGDLDVVSLIWSLTEKNLIQVEEHTEPLRYGMLETIRQFAFERLRKRDEEASARAAHVGVFLGLAEAAASHLWKAERLEWLGRIEADEANIREAMTFVLADPDPDVGPLAMRLFIAMSRYWEMTGQAAYVLDVAHSLLAHPGTQERNALWIRTIAALALVWRGDNWQLAVFTPVATEAADLARERGLYEDSSMLHWVLGTDLTRHGQLLLGRQITDGAIEDARRSGDLTALGVALIGVSTTVSEPGSAPSWAISPAARPLLEEALSCLRRAGDVYWEPCVLNNLAEADMVSGDYSAARQLIAEGIALSRAAATNDVLTTLLSNLAEVELEQGNIESAQAACEEALRTQVRTALLDHVSGTLIGMVAGCAFARGEFEAAAHLYGGAQAVSDHADIELAEWVDRRQERLRKNIGESAFSAAFAHGYSLDPREALKVSLAWTDENPSEGTRRTVELR